MEEIEASHFVGHQQPSLQSQFQLWGICVKRILVSETDVTNADQSQPSLCIPKQLLCMPRGESERIDACVSPVQCRDKHTT